jgi:putative transposase
LSVATEARCEIVSSVPKEVAQGDDTVRRSRDKFGGGFAHCVKDARPKLGTALDLDEVFVTLRDEPYLPRRAVDQQRSDLMSLQPGSFSSGCLLLAPRAAYGRNRPTAQLSGGRPKSPRCANSKHVFVKASARANNRSEDGHQAAHERERGTPASGFLYSRRRCCRAQTRSGSTSCSSDRPYANRSAHRSAAQHGFIELTQDPSDSEQAQSFAPLRRQHST